jgi:hypothetical protein
MSFLHWCMKSCLTSLEFAIWQYIRHLQTAGKSIIRLGEKLYIIFSSSLISPCKYLDALIKVAYKDEKSSLSDDTIFVHN